MNVLTVEPLDGPVHPLVLQEEVIARHPAAVVPDAAGMLAGEDEAVATGNRAHHVPDRHGPSIVSPDVERAAIDRGPDWKPPQTR